MNGLAVHKILERISTRNQASSVTSGGRTEESKVCFFFFYADVPSDEFHPFGHGRAEALCFTMKTLFFGRNKCLSRRRRRQLAPDKRAIMRADLSTDFTAACAEAIIYFSLFCGRLIGRPLLPFMRR
ncbi:hypothetical protein NPIL_663781 [Nephila pilipes]|uniref:Uncharacterized protein n=1 Tax=Nephila pilipes TaxID=299642 RepID=A0A8X6QQV9_NEPPI|nr:hypothetical protein NPIL_663781 [Nephila pilipes]